MPELRKDPITGRWVIIATDRAKRPSDFIRQQVEIKGVRFCPFVREMSYERLRRSWPIGPVERQTNPAGAFELYPDKFPVFVWKEH